jgi:stage II sporulation protein M
MRGGTLLNKPNKFRQGLSNHIKSNKYLYLLVLVFFSVGIAAGAFTVKALDEVQKQSLFKYIQGFFQVLTSQSVDSAAILKQSIINSVQTVAAIWILGITIIGIPVTLLVIGIRGFILGFTVGFLIDTLGWNGLLFTVAAIIPQNVVIIPCIIAISVFSLSFSLMIIKNRMSKRWTNNYWQKLLSYSINVIVLLLLSIIGSFIEAYIVPELLKLVSQYLIS